MSLLSFFLIILLAKCQSQDIMDFKEQSPNSGEDSPDTVYKAGDPGADWTPEEIDSTRQRILQVKILNKRTISFSSYSTVFIAVFFHLLIFTRQRV